MNELQHLFGERLGNVTHMCPAPNCGQHPLLLCRWCSGSGKVSEADYHRFAAWWNDQVLKGEMPA